MVTNYKTTEQLIQLELDLELDLYMKTLMDARKSGYTFRIVESDAPAKPDFHW